MNDENYDENYKQPNKVLKALAKQDKRAYTPPNQKLQLRQGKVQETGKGTSRSGLESSRDSVRVTTKVHSK